MLKCLKTNVGLVECRVPRQETKDAITFSDEDAQHYSMLAAEGVDEEEKEERQHLFAKLTRLRMACAHPRLQEAAERVREVC